MKAIIKSILKAIGFSFLFTLYLSIYIPIWFFSKSYAFFTSKESLIDMFLPFERKVTRDRKREEIESRKGITTPLNKFFLLCFNRLKGW